MSDDDLPPRRRRDAMPPVFWALMGVLIVAAFVLAAVLLNPVH
jgi:hypothetical protein